MQAQSVSGAVRGSIEDFLLDYAHRIDDGDLRGWPDFFTEDGTYKIVTRENFEAGLPVGIMLCEGRGMMADRMLALETANIFEPHTYCHLLGRPSLSAAVDGRYKVRTNFSVIRTMQDGTSQIFATGKYLDVIVMDDGRPLLAERLAVLESRRVDILLVYPL